MTDPDTCQICGKDVEDPWTVKNEVDGEVVDTFTAHESCITERLDQVDMMRKLGLFDDG